MVVIVIVHCSPLHFRARKLDQEPKRKRLGKKGLKLFVDAVQRHAMDKISQVFNNLFIGGEFVAAYREVLVEHNVRFILNCAAPQCKSHFAHEVENYVSESIVLWDAEDANAAQYFDATFDFIGTVRNIANAIYSVGCKDNTAIHFEY
jgi:hypothetical protein